MIYLIKKFEEPDVSSSDKEKGLTVASVIGRGTTCAIVGFAVGYGIANTAFGGLIGMIVGYIIGTRLKRDFVAK